MEHEPQVILQGKDNKLFLVDDSGIISTFTDSRDYYEHVIIQLVNTNVVSESCSALRESNSELKRLQCELEMQSQELTLVKERLHLVKLEEKQKSLEQVEKIKELQQSLAKEKQKAKQFWREKCDQQLAHEDALEKKDDKIKLLSRQLQYVKIDQEKKCNTPLTNNSNLRGEILDVPTVSQREMAPPVHLFTVEGSDELWDEWLPTFKGAAEWVLLQLAGNLQGKNFCC